MNLPVIHLINESHLLHGFGYDDLKAGDAELYILITVFATAGAFLNLGSKLFEV